MTIRLTRALLVLPLLACARGDAGDASTLDRPPSMLVKPNPVSVRATVDTSMEIEEYIEARKGGQVATYDQERGLMYTLTIPPNALFADERISIAPVRAIDGLPLSGGLTGAVRLEPDGLQLAAPATLHIASFDMKNGRMTTPPGPHVGFAAEGDGREFHLNVAGTSDSGVVIHLSHFSLEGGARGTPADIAAQSARAPSSPSAQYQQRIAAAIALASADAGSEGASVSDAKAAALHDELVRLHRGAYHDVVRPALVAGAGSDDALASAAAAYFTWMRSYMLLGIPEAEFEKEAAEGQKLLEAAMKAAYKRAVDRCRKGIDLGAIQMMLMLERSAQLLGYDEPGMFPDVFEQIEACGSVELAFESKIDFYWADGVTNSHDVVRALVPIRYDLVKRSFHGKGTLEYVSASGVVDGRMGNVVGGCMLRTIGPSKPGEFEVMGLFLARNPKTDARAALGDSISLMIDPGTPKNRYRAEQCKALGTAVQGTVEESDGWRPGWEDQHRREQLQRPDSLAARLAAGDARSEVPLAWVIDGFEPGDGRTVIARRTFDTTMTNQLAKLVERTTIELRRPTRRDP